MCKEEKAKAIEYDDDDYCNSMCSMETLLNPVIEITDPEAANRFVELLAKAIEEREKNPKPEYPHCLVRDPEEIRRIVLQASATAKRHREEREREKGEV